MKKMKKISLLHTHIQLFGGFFGISVQEIAHNRGVCHMYLKEPEKVCTFCSFSGINYKYVLYCSFVCLIGTV